jgi:hypothetical protein
MIEPMVTMDFTVDVDRARIQLRQYFSQHLDDLKQQIDSAISRLPSMTSTEVSAMVDKRVSEMFQQELLYEVNAIALKRVRVLTATAIADFLETNSDSVC